MFQLFTSHHQAEELKDFYKRVLRAKSFHMYAICKNLKFFGLMMTRKELKHVAK
jgi:hypothetical protein